MKKNALKVTCLFLSTIIVVAFFLTAPVEANKGEKGTKIKLRAFNGESEPLGGIAVFLDKDKKGETSENGVKVLNGVTAGVHEIVAKETSSAITPVEVKVPKTATMSLKLLIAKDGGNPTQIGYAPSKPQAGEKVTFFKLNSGRSGSENSSISYRWDFQGDGIVDARGTTVTASYSSAGTRRINLTAVRDGEIVNTRTIRLDVNKANVPPKGLLDKNQERIFAGRKISFDASSSQDPDGEIKEYEWRFAGGIEKSGEIVSHTFQRPGNHTLKLSLEDDDGAQTTVKKELNVRPVTYLSQLFYKKGKGSAWTTAEKGSRNEPMELTIKEKGRNLRLFFERENDAISQIVHQIKPTQPGILEVIGQTVIKPDEQLVILSGKGYVQRGKITYNLANNTRRKKIMDWDGNVMTSSKIEIKKDKKNHEYTQHMFTINFLSKQSLESIALDILTTEDAEPLIVSTTELFNYRKLTSVKSSLRSGVKPSRYNLAPHLMAKPPKVIYATEKAKFDFVSFDPDGHLGKMVVDWGDGKKRTIEKPVSGKNKVFHTYSKAGEYEVEVTTYDSSNKENNFKKVNFEISVQEQKKERKQNKEGGHDQPLMYTTGGVLSLN